MSSSIKQRGSIIIYALLTMSAMLAIALTLTSLFIGKLRSAAAARDSAVSIYIADSAAEMCLYEAREKTPLPPMTFDPSLNGATYTVTDVSGGTDISGDCSVLGSNSFDFRATGQYHGVRRTLEIGQ